MKMNDMGKLAEGVEACTPVESNSKKEKYYPTTYLSSKEIPGLEDFDVGDSIKLCSVNNVVGKREKKDSEIELEVEIRQCGVMDGTEPPEADEYMDMTAEEKDAVDEKEVMGKK